MKAVSECIYCYLRQAHTSLSLVLKDEAKILANLKKLFPLIKSFSFEKTPGEYSTLVLKEVNRLLGVSDPYSEEKKLCNTMALEWESYLRKLVHSSSEPLLTAIKLSVVGNIIDLGIKEQIDIKKSIEQILSQGFRIDDSDAIIQKVKNDSNLNILIIGDNAGEILFDKILVEELLKYTPQVVYVVKSGPVINDALLEDAEAVGMTDICKIIETGNDWAGVVVDKCSEEMREHLRKADLIIAKGQANYETLTETAYPVFYTLKAKCPPVANHLGVKMGDLVCKYLLS
jgi:uncharacterized protein with ATP-grasp and redox domains